MTALAEFERPPKRATRSASAVLATGAVVLSAQLLSYAEFVQALLAFPYQLMEAEGLLLAMGMAILAGNSPYGDPSVYPWVVAPYAPLFAVLTGAIASVTGPTVAAGRVVSLVATLASVAILIELIARESRRLVGAPAVLSWAVAGTLGIGYLVSPFLFEWSPLSRVDMLALCFSLAAVRSALEWSDTRAWRWLTLSAGLCVLALWTKQTAVAAPAAIGLWLWFSHAKGRALTFISAAIGVSLVGYLVLDAWSNGGFADAAIESNALPWWPRVFANYVRRVVLLYPWFIAIGGLFVFDCLRRRRLELSCLYIVLTASSILAIGHTGAAMNYFIEPLAALTMGAGVVLSRLMCLGQGDKLSLGVTLALVLQMIWFTAADHSPLKGFFNRSPEWGYRPTRDDRLIVDRIGALVRERGGLILSEDPSLNVRTGAPIVAVPSSALTALTYYADWREGEAALLEEISAGRFRTIVLTRRDYPPAVLSAIESRYQVIDEADGIGAGYLVLTPR